MKTICKTCKKTKIIKTASAGAMMTISESCDCGETYKMMPKPSKEEYES